MIVVGNRKVAMHLSEQPATQSDSSFLRSNVTHPPIVLWEQHLPKRQARLVIVDGHLVVA